jgi:hypothetical protein
MKRKDYITENKSIEDINDILQTVFDQSMDVVDTMIEYFSKIPPSMWSQIPAIHDIMSSSTSVYILFNVYVEITLDTSPVRLDQKEAKALAEYVLNSKESGFYYFMHRCVLYNAKNIVAPHLVPTKQMWDKLDKKYYALQGFVTNLLDDSDTGTAYTANVLVCFPVEIVRHFDYSTSVEFTKARRRAPTDHKNDKEFKDRYEVLKRNIQRHDQRDKERRQHLRDRSK